MDRLGGIKMGFEQFRLGNLASRTRFGLRVPSILGVEMFVLFGELFGISDDFVYGFLFSYRLIVWKLRIVPK